MPQGLQTFHPDGRLDVDITDRMTRFVGDYALNPSPEGFVAVAGMSPETHFLTCNQHTTPGSGPFFRIEYGGFRYRWTAASLIRVKVFAY